MIVEAEVEGRSSLRKTTESFVAWPMVDTPTNTCCKRKRGTGQAIINRRRSGVPRPLRTGARFGNRKLIHQRPANAYTPERTFGGGQNPISFKVRHDRLDARLARIRSNPPSFSSDHACA